MPSKLRSKTILESQEGLVPTMVEQFEINTTNFLQGKFASDSPFGQEAGIGNIDDDDIHVPNVVEFQAMIKDLRRSNALTRQRFDEKMVARLEVESKQLKVLAEKTKSMSEYAQVPRKLDCTRRT